MKLKTLALLCALGTALLGTHLVADETVPPTPPTPPAEGMKPDRPGKPERPDHARPNLHDEVKKVLDELAQARKAFATEQKELMKKLRDASAEEREQIKEDMKTNREDFIESQKALREEIRGRLKEISTEFANQRDGMLDAAKEGGKRGRGR